MTQDEPVTAHGDKTSPDAERDGDQVMVRAESAKGKGGNGRVYRIAFTVTDSEAQSCTGTATVGVPPKKKDNTAVDDGDTNSWDSFTGNAVP